MLAEAFPQCFVVFEGRRRPLKLHIDRDIMAALPEGTVGPIELKAALRYYTNNRGYLRALLTKGQRIDLQGQPVGEVSLDHALKAGERLFARAKTKPAGPTNPPPNKPATANPIPSTTARRGDGFEGLRAAARARRELKQAQGK
jgi:ProP effector